MNVPIPRPTSREEKLQLASMLSERLLVRFGEKIMAIGVYGSLGKEIDGPYSDIEMHVVVREPLAVDRYEFVYDDYKIEVDIQTADALLQEAATVDDMWPIAAGSFIHVLPITDPEGFFDRLRSAALSQPESAFRQAIRQFVIDEVYETMGKVRNARVAGTLSYLPMAARDMAWQTAKLVGLANRKYYATRATTLEESLTLPNLPAGYRELVQRVLAGDLSDRAGLVDLLERLWLGITDWLNGHQIRYQEQEIPF